MDKGTWKGGGKRIEKGGGDWWSSHGEVEGSNDEDRRDGCSRDVGRWRGGIFVSTLGALAGAVLARRVGSGGSRSRIRLRVDENAIDDVDDAIVREDVCFDDPSFYGSRRDKRLVALGAELDRLA